MQPEESIAYPANANDPSLSAVGLPQGKFDVEASGQATFRVSIEVPPGIAERQPHLELVYSHRQGNGVLGVGWDLAGMSSISRTRATYAVDGFNGAIAFNSKDRYSLDGQRLINVEGEYGDPGTLYYTEIQTWKHVRAGASSAAGFTVCMKNGETWKYGASRDSFVMAPGSTDAELWALTTIIDRHGNSIEYSYTQTPLLANGTRGTGDEGSNYIDKISYGSHNGTLANRFVQFIYEYRPDPINSFVGGNPVDMSYRLKQITTSLTGNIPVRSYAMEYRTSGATGRSCLENITEIGANAAVLPSTAMRWQDVASPNFEIGAQSQLDQHLTQLGIQLIDVSGSGRTDVVQFWSGLDGAINATSYLATQGPAGVTFIKAANSVLGSFPREYQLFPMDLDGNGLTDLLIAYKGSNGNLKLAAFLSNGKGFDEIPEGPIDTGDPWYESQHLKFFAMDANGDGRTDLVEAYVHNDRDRGDLLYFRSYLSKFGDDTPELFTPAIISPTIDQARPTDLLSFWAMDVNGDGMMDLVRIWQRGSDQHIIATAYISLSKSIDDVSFASQVESDLGTFSLATQKAFLPIDVNGNGVSDLLQVWQEQTATGTKLHLTTFLCNAAGGFVVGPDTIFTDRRLGEFFPMGFNGCGLTALVNKWISGNDKLMFTVYMATPSGTFWEQTSFDAGPAGSSVQLAKFYAGDINGDGKADLVRVSQDMNLQFNLVSYISAGVYPDLVKTITNALGGMVAITYLPLSDPQVYSQANQDEPAFPQAKALRYPNPMTPAQFPVQAVLGQATYVVSAYCEQQSSDINRFNYFFEYEMTYSEACLNLLGRGWQGFRTVSKLDRKNGRKTVCIYNQDFPFTGTLASVRTEADGSYTSDPRVPRNQHALLMNADSSEFKSYTRGTGTTGLKMQVVEVLKVSSRLEVYNYGIDHFDYALGQTFDYDDYGNQKNHVQLGYVDRNNEPLNPSAVVYRFNLYLNNVSSGGWALGFPLYAKVTSNAIDPDIRKFLPGDYHLEQKSYLPSTYDLASHSQWDNVHNIYLSVNYEYDPFGNRIKEISPGGFVTLFEYEPGYHTFRMRVTSPENEQGTSLVTLYGYDPRFGTEVVQCDANSNFLITILDAFGRKALRQGPPSIQSRVTDPNALTSLVTGTPELRQAFLATTVVTVEITNYANDLQGGLYTEVSSLQKFPVDVSRDFNWSHKYIDGMGRIREEVNQSGQRKGNVVTLTDYDADGKTVLQSLPFFSANSIVSLAPHSIASNYDVLGRPLTKNVPAGPAGNNFSITTWDYQSGGQVTITSAAGSDTPYIQIMEHYFYDGNDKVRESVIPADNDAKTTFAYDTIARLRDATDPATPTNPKGVYNSFTYDSLDRKLTFDNPDQNTTNNPNIKAFVYEYDASTGQLKREINAAEEATIFEYDQLSRIKTKTLSDLRVIRYTYDDPVFNGRGRLTQVKVEASDHSTESMYDFGYDAYGNITTSRLTIAGEPTPFITQSIFDPQGRLVSQTLPDGNVLHRQYSFGQLINQTLDGASVDYPLEEYDALGKAWKLIYGKGILPDLGVVTNYTYNPTGQIYAEVVQGSGGDVLNLAYKYDLLSQILGITDLKEPGGSQQFTYLNKRLQTAQGPGFDSGNYAYDSSGNITGKDGVIYSYSAHFPTSGKANGNTVYSAIPDLCGRTKTRRTGNDELQFDYDGLGSLRRVSRTITGVNLREILSDYTGLRLRQTDADGTQTIFVSSSFQVTRPVSGPPSITKFLLDDRGAVASVATGPASAILYFRRNHKGSVTHTFGNDATVLSVAAYSGYGALKIISGPDDFRPKYENREWDAIIGLYYFGARYYDPITARFLTPDSQLGGQSYLQADVLNRYAFELNNPINITDASGHSANWIAGLFIGLAALVAGAIVIVATAGTATPLVAAGWAALSGALVGGGISATAYSVTHRDDFSWKDFAIESGIGAAVGGITGGAFSGLSNIAVLNATALRSFLTSVIGTAAISSAADVTGQFFTNLAEGNDLSSGLARSAMFGAIFGAAGGALGFGFAKAVERYALKFKPALTAAAEQQSRDVNDALLNSTHADLSKTEYTSFGRPVDEALPLLMTKKVESIMNGRTARFTQLLLSTSSAFPESYLEHEEG